MIKAKLFDYRDSKTYYRRYGITPDRHFGLLCELWDREDAIKILDENMQKAYEEKWKEEQKRLEAECPF